MRECTYYALLLLTSLLWGGNFVAGKFLVGHASTLMLTEMRWGLAVLFLLPYVWLREKRLLPPRQALLPLFLMGITGVILFNLFMFLALERTSADNTGLLSALNPVSIALASFFLLRERIKWQQAGAMFISLVGVLVVITHGDWQKLLHLRFNTGDLFMLAAVAMWGVYSVAGKKAMQAVSPFMSTLWSGIFGCLILLPFTLPSFSLNQPTVAFWTAALYVSVGATVLAMVIWNIGVQKVGGTKSGMFLNFNPIFTAVLAWLFLHEQMTVIQGLGTLLVIGGVYLFTRSGRERSYSPPPVQKSGRSL
jgi:drug/metabolite transporter (DMT)-like permease